jgi:hypothetical protein
MFIDIQGVLPSFFCFAFCSQVPWCLDQTTIGGMAQFIKFDESRCWVVLLSKQCHNPATCVCMNNVQDETNILPLEDVVSIIEVNCLRLDKKTFQFFWWWQDFLWTHTTSLWHFVFVIQCPMEVLWYSIICIKNFGLHWRHRCKDFKRGVVEWDEVDPLIMSLDCNLTHFVIPKYLLLI